MNISITKIKKEDIDFIKNLEIECNLSSWSKNDYIKEIKRKDSISLLLKYNNARCGFLIARLIGDRTHIDAEIYNIAIKPLYRNNNFGTLLLEELIKKGMKHELKSIFLEVRESNNIAMNFYEKNKFTRIVKRPNFYLNPLEGAILMYRRIDS